MLPLVSPNAPRRKPSSQCEVCRNWGPRRVCSQCTAHFAPARLRCTRCAITLGAAPGVCGECLRDPPPYTRAVSAADYAFPWDGLVIDFKFHGSVELAQPLSAMMCCALRAAGGTGAADLVAPIPLSAQRLAERGFNQAWELARRVGPNFGLPTDASLLQRPIDSAHQADLPRDQRALNLRGAFMVNPKRRAQLAGRHVALVDDVLTTGATARAASVALLRAGALSVQVWTMARTP